MLWGKTMNTKDSDRVMGELVPGDHACCAYRSGEDFRRIAVSAVLDGLRMRQRVVHIADRVQTGSVVLWLNRQGVDVERHIDAGALVLSSYEDAYFRGGRFEPQATISLLQGAVRRSLAAGFPALRIVSDMTWLLHNATGADKRLAYEASLSQLAADKPVLALCLYDSAAFSLHDMVAAHGEHPLRAHEDRPRSHRHPPTRSDVPRAALLY